MSFIKAVPLLVALLASNAFAGEDLLVTAKTPDGSVSTPIYIVTDANGDLAGLKVHNVIYNAAQFRAGIDLHVKDHSGILVVYATNIDLHTGGKLRLNYNTDKANIFARNKNLVIDIHRGEDGKWHLFEGDVTVRTLAITPAARGISSISPVAMLAGNPDKILNGLTAPYGDAKPSVEDDFVAKYIPTPNPAESEDPDRAKPSETMVSAN